MEYQGLIGDGRRAQFTVNCRCDLSFPSGLGHVYDNRDLQHSSLRDHMIRNLQFSDLNHRLKISSSRSRSYIAQTIVLGSFSSRAQIPDLGFGLHTAILSFEWKRLFDTFYESRAYVEKQSMGVSKSASDASQSKTIHKIYIDSLKRQDL